MNDPQSAAGVRRRRDCGYRYMLPSYALDEESDPTTSYLVVADALLENSSAHGLPTLYRARGFNFRLQFSHACSFSVKQFVTSSM